MRTYDQYVRKEWELFQQDPARADSTKEIIKGVEVRRVLDIGCGAGQELLPFIQSGETFGVGLDLQAEVGSAGRELFSSTAFATRVVFVRGGAEALPFASTTFDAVICRLALPYTNNAQTLDEISRVMVNDGLLFMKYHHLRYYVTDLRKAVKAFNFLFLIHTVRVLVTGIIYHITRYQPRRFPSSETFQTNYLFRKELTKVGLNIIDELRDSNPLTPAFLIKKNADSHTKVT